MRKNALTAEKPPPVIDSSPPSREAISVLLPSFQEYGPIERWLRASSFLNAMMELTRRITNKIRSPNNETAFISLKPEHLVLSRDDQIIKESDIIGHYTYREYLGQLMVLDPLFSSLSSDPSSFLPVWWQSRLQRVSVRQSRIDSDSESTNTTGTEGILQITTRATDFTMPGQTVQPGDFLLISNDESTHSLYEVNSVRENGLEVQKNIVVEKERENSSVEFELDEERGGYLVKAFDACSYYGGMLAVYLFYALFSGDRKRGVEHFGRSVISNALYFPMKSLLKPSEVYRKERRRWSLNRKGPAAGRELVRYAIRLYVWLMLGGFHSDRNQMDSIRSEVSKWKDQVADSLGKPADDVDALIFQYSEDGEFADNRDHGSELLGALEFDEDIWEQVARSYIGGRL